MRNHIFICYLFLFSFVAGAEAPVSLHLSDLEELSPIITDVLKQKVPSRYDIPGQELQECRNHGFKCWSETLRIDLGLNSPALSTTTTFLAGKKLRFNVNSPDALFSTHFKIRKEVLGMRTTFSYDLKIQGLNLGSEGILLHLGNAPSARVARVDLGGLTITPRDSKSEALLKLISLFTDIKGRLEKEIEGGVVRQLQSPEMSRRLSNEIETLLVRSFEDRVITVDEGLDVHFLKNTYSTGNDSLTLKSQAVFDANIVDTACQLTKANGDVSLSRDFILDALNAIVSYSNDEREPLLCLQGSEQWKWSFIKLGYDWLVKPRGEISYQTIKDDGENLLKVTIPFHVFVKGKKKWPRMLIKRDDSANMADVDLTFELTPELLEDEVVFKVSDITIKLLEGRLKIALVGNRVGPLLGKKRLESILAKSFIDEIHERWGEELRFARSYPLFPGYSLKLEKLVMEKDIIEIKTKLIKD